MSKSLYDEPPPDKGPRVYKNRIVGHGEEDPEALASNPRNWRIHPRAQEDALAGVLSEVGWVDTVLVNQRTGYVVDGHLRVAHAISKGEPSVPVTYVDLSEEEEGLVLATLDPLSALAVTDQPALDVLIAETHTDDAVLVQFLARQRLGTTAVRTVSPHAHHCPKCGHEWS